jgi:hypothetical protein
MWKEAEDGLKQKYRDDEAALWVIYKEGMVEWRKKNDGRKKASKALEAAAALKLKQKKAAKKKGSKSKNAEEETSLADNSFDDSHFGGFGAQGLESGNAGLNQDGKFGQYRFVVISLAPSHISNLLQTLWPHLQPCGGCDLDLVVVHSSWVADLLVYQA